MSKRVARNATDSTARSTGAGRVNPRLWRKGQSGNPGGRRRVDPAVRKLAIGHSIEAIETMVEVMRNRKAGPSVRLAAAVAILDRGHGRPPSELDLRVKETPPLRGLSPERVREIRTLVLGIDIERDAPPPIELRLPRSDDTPS